MPAFLAIVVLPFAGGCGDETTSRSLNGITHTPVRQVGNVTLPEVTESNRGVAATFKPATGELSIVYFGYAFCPDICPTTFADLSVAIRRLPAVQRKRVTVSFITVDPKRDTPPLLRKYMSHFFTDSRARVFRTTGKKELGAAEKAFGASHQTGEPDRRGGYDVAHTTYLYAVDDAGEVTLQWPFGMTSADIAADLKVLLDR